MYTYEEIKTELLSEIEYLISLDPKWEKCSKCPYSGYCCIGADLSIYQYEWDIISTFLTQNPDILLQVRENFNSDSKCYFRVSDRCLIHDIRPLNCIFTPYQALYSADKRIHYTPYSTDCHSGRLSIDNDNYDLSTPYIQLPISTNSTAYYLLLNHWYFNYEMKSIVANSYVNLADNLEHFLAQY